MILLLTKILIRIISPVRIIHLGEASRSLFMGINTVLQGHTKKIEGAGQGYFVWYPKARIDLKMIHDENYVLTDDELVVARNF